MQHYRLVIAKEAIRSAKQFARAFRKDLSGKELEKTEFFILEQKKLVYVVNPKAGCSSIQRTLLEAADVDGSFDLYLEIHATAKELGYRTRTRTEEQKAYYTFSFTRNPFKRIVSLYRNKFEHLDSIREYGFTYKNYLGGIFHQDDSFATFVDKMVCIPDRLADDHFKSQTALFTDVGRIDLLARLEDISVEFPVLQARFDLPPLAHANKSDRYDYRQYLTADLLAKLYRRYRVDVEKLGYADEYLALRKHLTELPEAEWKLVECC